MLTILFFFVIGLIGRLKTKRDFDSGVYYILDKDSFFIQCMGYTAIVLDTLVYVVGELFIIDKVLELCQ